MTKHRYSKDEIAAWRKEKDRYIIYFNPDDSNLVVPKASGLGITFNFAHPVAWVILAAVIGIIIWQMMG